MNSFVRILRPDKCILFLVNFFLVCLDEAYCISQWLELPFLLKPCIYNFGSPFPTLSTVACTALSVPQEHVDLALCYLWSKLLSFVLDSLIYNYTLRLFVKFSQPSESSAFSI